jgi:hypothetical protein
MIVTIDVGLKNLAICIMECENPKELLTYNIKLWNVYNTLETPVYLCNGILKSGKVCGKRCLYKYSSSLGNLEYTCKLHFPKTQTIKQNNHYKQKRVDEYLLQDITKIVLTKMNSIFEENSNLFDNVTKVLIELQPKINNKMKLISHLIYGKFVELFINKPSTIIRFVRAAQKLKAYKGPIITCNLKGAYARRKYLSIQYTKWFLNNKFSNEEREKWFDVFESNTKQDDLGDVFLMAINGFN